MFISIRQTINQVRGCRVLLRDFLSNLTSDRNVSNLLDDDDIFKI